MRSMVNAVLRIPVDKIAVIAALAREVLGHMPPEDEPETVDGAAEDGGRPSSEDYEEERHAGLFDYVDALNGDELADLLALVWVGRGDFPPEEWTEAQATADDAVADGDAVAEIIQNPTLPDDLEAGLDALGYES